MIVSAAWILPAVFAVINRIVQARLQGWEPATLRDVLFEFGDWFLYALLTPGVFAVNSGSKEWSNRAAIFEGAKGFAESGAKLVKLEFPKTEIQAYGNTVLIYTTYVYEIEKDAKRTTTSGRGTEMFVRRGDELVNVGWHLDEDK